MSQLCCDPLSLMSVSLPLGFYKFEKSCYWFVWMYKYFCIHDSNKILLRKYIVLFSLFSPVCLLTILEEIYLWMEAWKLPSRLLEMLVCSAVFWRMSQGKDHYTFTLLIVQCIISRSTPAGADWDLCISLWYVLCEILHWAEGMVWCGDCLLLSWPSSWSPGCREICWCFCGYTSSLQRLMCLTLHEGAHPYDKTVFPGSAKTHVFAWFWVMWKAVWITV